MQNIHGFDYFPLNFDQNGALVDAASMTELKGRAAKATDLIFFAHGFRNNEQEATTLYSNFLDTFRGQFTRPEFAGLAARNYVVAGVYWPSKQFPESFGPQEGAAQAVGDDAAIPPELLAKLDNLEAAMPEHAATLQAAAALLPRLDGDAAAQDRFAALVLSTVSDGQLDDMEGIGLVRQQRGSEMFQKLAPALIAPAPTDGDGTGGSISDAVDGPGDDAGSNAQSVGSFFGSVMGGVDKFLNLTTWYVMKNRAGVVGQAGVAQAVRDMKTAFPNLKVHLVGHSLGGRLMAACSKALAQDPQVRPHSVTLLEAAFSHFGFSPNNGMGKAGFFRDVIEKKVVIGPLLATYSAQDEAVGTDFAITSRLAGNTTSAVGDENDPYGGIGRNGALKTAESEVLALKDASAATVHSYTFKMGIVTCLNGSGGLIKNHGDVTSVSITYAFACSVNAT